MLIWYINFYFKDANVFFIFSDAIEDYVPCKFICSYNVDKESEGETESTESEGEKEEEKVEAQPEEKRSWCFIQ